MLSSEKKILSDPLIEPTDEFICHFLGDKKIWWHTIIDGTIKNYPNVTGVWKYYNRRKTMAFQVVTEEKHHFLAQPL